MDKPSTTSNASADEAANSRAKRTPNTDMQPEDAGTADSGVEDRASNAGSDANNASNARPSNGTSADSAMKQTSKTDSERGSR